MLKNQALLKTVSLYLIYFVYTYFTGYLVQMLSFMNDTVIKMLLDFIFLILMVVMYQKNLKEELKDLKKNYTLGKILKIVLFGVVATFVLNIGMGALSEAIYPNLAVDQNTQAIQNLASISMLYTLFKTMFFGVIAEELLFREALSECIENNGLFIILSAVIYTAMNFVFATNINSETLFMELAIYFLPALLFSFLYTKNKRNIILIMLMKFIYNFVPLIILISDLV